MSYKHREILNLCKDIIRNEKNVEKAVRKIANIKYNDDKKLGLELAVKVYYRHAECAVKYIDKKYANNISEYENKIEKKRLKALEMLEKSKK